MQSYLSLLSIGWTCSMDNGFLFGGAEHLLCIAAKLVCVIGIA